MERKKWGLRVTAYWGLEILIWDRSEVQAEAKQISPIMILRQWSCHSSVSTAIKSHFVTVTTIAHTVVDALKKKLSSMIASKSQTPSLKESQTWLSAEVVKQRWLSTASRFCLKFSFFVDLGLLVRFGKWFPSGLLRLTDSLDISWHCIEESKLLVPMDCIDRRSVLAVSKES
jgi:hypothetical protein